MRHHGSASGATRREILKSLAAAGAVLSASRLLAQVAAPKSAAARGRIDVHHHLYPPTYVKAMEAEMKAAGFTARPWTPAISLDMMDKAGVARRCSHRCSAW